MVDKQKRGAENCLLQGLFYLRDFNLASYARVIDTHSLLWMEGFPKGKFLQFMQMSQVYRLDGVFFHKLHHPPCCLGSFTDYGRQFHEDDRDTRSQSKNEEGLLVHLFKWLPGDLGATFLIEASAKVW